MNVIKRIGNVVRDFASRFGPAMIYTRSVGYFRKDEFDGPEWQFGADYYECQKMYARLEKGETLSNEEMKKIIVNYCSVMHRAAYLRSMYNSAMDVLEGRAEFRDE